MRSCGNCTLCCTLLGVHQLDKKPFEHCRHCNVGSGCMIYQIRPTECHDFNCLWLLGGVDEDLKPENCHVILSDLQTDMEKLGLKLDENENRRVMMVYVDPNFPGAHKQGKMKDYLNYLLKSGIELVVLEKEKKMLMKWGTIDDENLSKDVHGNS